MKDSFSKVWWITYANMIIQIQDCLIKFKSKLNYENIEVHSLQWIWHTYTHGIKKKRNIQWGPNIIEIPEVVKMPTLSSLEAPQVVIMTISVISDNM